MGSNSGNTKAPLFDGTNYSFWKLRMQAFIKSLGYDVWEAVRIGYNASTTPTDAATKKLVDNDSKAQNALYSGLVDSELVKVMTCKIAKEIWDKLQSIHEGDEKIKEAKLQTYHSQFESLHMVEDENIDTYMLRVNEVTNSIRELGEEIKEPVIVKKVLRSLQPRFDSKVSAIEEAKDLNAFSMDELHGSFTAYEMRIGKTSTSDREVAFKVQKKAKEVADSDDDELEAQFVRKLKKCSNGKYKGKLPFKCFNCGGVGHFAAKCPLKEDDNDSYTGKSQWKKSFSKKGKTKSFISQHNDSTSKTSDDDHSAESTEALFMVTVEEKEEGIVAEEDDADVNLEEELIAALEELSMERKTSKKNLKRLHEFESSVITLKPQVEEYKRTVEVLKNQISVKTEEVVKLEIKITGARAENLELNKKLKALEAIEGTMKLNEILKVQRPSHYKFGLGYEIGESSMSAPKSVKQNANPLKNVFKCRNVQKFTYFRNVQNVFKCRNVQKFTYFRNVQNVFQCRNVQKFTYFRNVQNVFKCRNVQKFTYFRNVQNVFKCRNVQKFTYFRNVQNVFKFRNVQKFVEEGILQKCAEMFKSENCLQSAIHGKRVPSVDNNSKGGDCWMHSED
ncbi:hypothetical protein MRB53_010565 [Persea americana]|uniref:Uncharacterized protein n=1 Tax=Persea americana TaxID=3435 RepID=A0ACC2LSY8_PERAE|nr:hypothetical protein MRB53_010565 [Persea americana]